MKKTSCYVLLVCLLFGAAHAYAAKAPTKEDIGALTDAIYATHTADHVHFALETEDVSPAMAFSYGIRASEDLLICSEYHVEEKRKIPTDGKAINKLFLEYFEDARAITAFFEDTNIVNLEKFDEVYGGKVSLTVLPSTWWYEGKTEEHTSLIGIIGLADEKNAIIDDALYLFGLITDDSSATIWICADQLLVYEYLASLPQPDQARIKKDALEMYVVSWIDTYKKVLDPSAPQSYFLLEEPTAAPADETAAPTATKDAPADEPSSEDPATDDATPDPTEAAPTPLPIETIGKVTITNNRRVFLRDIPSTDGRIIGSAEPGDVLDCVNVEDNGWYAVLHEGGIAYVSNRMSERAE